MLVFAEEEVREVGTGGTSTGSGVAERAIEGNTQRGGIDAASTISIIQDDAGIGRPILPRGTDDFERWRHGVGAAECGDAGREFRRGHALDVLSPYVRDGVVVSHAWKRGAVGELHFVVRANENHVRVIEIRRGGEAG